MSVNLTVNSVVYAYPELDDENWAAAATGWAQAVTAGMLQKAGGSFTLTADVNFGATYGLISQYYKSRSSNVASAGQIRLANTDTIKFRNAANGADLSLSINAANDHLLFEGHDLSAASSSGNVIGPVSSTDNAVVKFDGITGQLIKDSGVIIDNSNNVSGVVALSASSAVITNDVSAKTATLDNGATHGGRVNFDGGSSSYVGSSADGATLQVAGFTDASVPAGVANDVRDATTRPTGTSVGVGGVAISTSSGSFSTSSASYVDVTNLSVTITTSGRPVRIFLMPNGSASAFISASNISAVDDIDATESDFRLKNASVALAEFNLECTAQSRDLGANNALVIHSPPGVIDFVDAAAAGTYTYTLQARSNAGGTAAVLNCKLVAYEL